MSDLISRKALCEYALNQKNKSITPNDIMRFPSAQPETHEERTETHACDLIGRQAAIDAVKWGITYARAINTCTGETKELFKVSNHALNEAVERLKELPPAQPEQTNSWCIDCKEYDTENKCCPRYNRVIKQTLDEVYAHAETEAEARFHAQQRWIPCSERLPEPRVAVLGYAPKFKNIFALYYDSVMGWMVWSPIRDDCLPNSQGDIIAWMPLPELYREEGD